MNESVFTVIDPSTRLGGAEYPFLKDFSDWMIISSPLELSQDELLEHPLASISPDGVVMVPEPTLEWVKDNKINTLYVTGVGLSEFLSRTGLEITIGDGVGLATAKRISRVMRPTFVYDFRPVEDLRVQRLELSEPEMKAIDGAGVVHRRVLLSMIDKLPVRVSAIKRKALSARLKHIERVEFTLVGPLGEEKGHAVVSDTIEPDFIVPLDVKTDLKLTGGQVYIGFDLSFKGKHSALLDRQSLLDLYPFYNDVNLAQWMRLEGDFYDARIHSGHLSELMGRIEADDALDSVTGWHLMEFAASGGDFMWSRALTRAAYNQHIHRIASKYQDKLRFPIPGGSAYVMTDAVADLAGFGDVNVQPGQVKIDLKRATVWVNRHDWTSHLATLWGGADSDDRLNIQQYTDPDGVRKVLLWRSPNQQGEYVVLLPTDDSDVIAWETNDGAIRYPALDDRHLPMRIDECAYLYTGEIDDKVRLGSKSYSVANMQFAINRAIANSGALGMYCNMLMVMVAVHGQLPRNLHLPLEVIIDATVKDGRDVSSAKDWCYFKAGEMLARGVHIPHLVADKFAGLIGKDKAFALTIDHWLDKLERATSGHIQYMERLRDSAMSQCVMPAELSAHVLEMADARYGDGFLRVYNAIMAEQIRHSGGQPKPEHHERARQRCEAYVKTSGANVLEILVGALSAANHGDQNDTACWQLPAEGCDEGFAQLTIQALRLVGLLMELEVTEEGLVAYPRAEVPATKRIAIRVRGVWYNWLRVSDQALASATMGEIVRQSPDKAKSAKALIAQWASAGVLNREWRIETRDDRKVFMTQNNNIFGFVDKTHQHLLAEGTVKFLSAFATDGDVTAVIEHQSA